MTLGSLYLYEMCDSQIECPIMNTRIAAKIVVFVSNIPIRWTFSEFLQGENRVKIEQFLQGV